MNSFFYKLGLLLLGIMFPILASAQLNGHNLRGDYGMASGTVAPTGHYLSPFYVNYDTQSLRDRDGEEVSRGGGIEVDAVSLIYQWVSDKQILGGNYSLMVAPSWANNRLAFPALDNDFETFWGLGDLYVQPLILGWNKERADFMAGIGVFAPTGRYTDGANDNTGLGMWTFEIFGGTTIYLDKAKSGNSVCNHGFTCGGIRHIHLQWQGHITYQGSSLCNTGFIDIRQYNPGAPVGKLYCRGTSDTACGTCYNDYLPFKITHWLHS